MRDCFMRGPKKFIQIEQLEGSTQRSLKRQPRDKRQRMNPQDTSALGQEGKLEWEISDFAQCVYIDATLHIQDGDRVFIEESVMTENRVSFRWRLAHPKTKLCTNPDTPKENSLSCNVCLCVCAYVRVQLKRTGLDMYLCVLGMLIYCEYAILDSRH